MRRVVFSLVCVAVCGLFAGCCALDLLFQALPFTNGMSSDFSKWDSGDQVITGEPGTNGKTDFAGPKGRSSYFHSILAVLRAWPTSWSQISLARRRMTWERASSRLKLPGRMSVTV